MRKNNKRIIPKPHAYLHYMQKASAKFQNNWLKTVSRKADLRPQDTHCPYTLTAFDVERKRQSSQSRKSKKKSSKYYTKTTCTSSFRAENICKVSKQSKENCKISCAHKVPTVYTIAFHTKTRGPLVLYRSPDCWGYVIISSYWGKDV